jgi:hypothetical protein
VVVAKKMTRWQPGRLRLASGDVLRVTVHGGSVTWRRGALELVGALDDARGVELTLEHPFTELAHVFVPHLAPEDGYVMGDRIFRAPAVILAHQELALALVPDLDDVAAAEGWRAWLDYDHARRRVVLGAGAYRAEGHAFYVREPIEPSGARVNLRLHVIASRRKADCDNPYGMAARFFWERWGGRAEQSAPLSAHEAHVARWAFSDEGWSKTVWQSIELDGVRAGGPVFIVNVTQHPSVAPEAQRWREPKSIWNQAWFSTQRCANGLLRYARQIGSSDLEERARLMTEVALAAPQDEGLFPAVLIAHGDRWGWTNSSRRPPSASERACHLVDAAFTCRMLLEWQALTAEPRALDYVLRFAERLVALQRPSGAFPGWVEPDGRITPELAESAETAVGATLLLELTSLGHERFREPSLAAVRYLEGLIADARWEDFETYYSCCRFGTPELIGRRVARNGVYKQNTLSMAWCSEAMLHAWVVARERRWLELARRSLDELSLYQAVWDPRFLPAPAYGGFGVMNADEEWNDARQSLFAPLYLELYRHMGDAELFERGVAALHASFSMLYCPENDALRRAYEARFPFFGPETFGFMMENQGHGGGIGEFTIYSWGPGSALAAAASVRDRFGDAFIDSARARAFGIDGVHVEVRGDRVHLRDRFERRALTAVYADGRRVAFRGSVSLPL